MLGPTRISPKNYVPQPSKMVSRPKHPPKVHVWGGISARGATAVVIFTGVLTATRYTDILDSALVPFLTQNFPTTHRFQQDNDPKHTSRWAQSYFEQNQINWWRTPPSSPDLNPVENVWGTMKNYLRTIAKPKNTQELIHGIKSFWKTLTPEVCKRYICWTPKKSNPNSNRGTRRAQRLLACIILFNLFVHFMDQVYYAKTMYMYKDMQL